MLPILDCPSGEMTLWVRVLAARAWGCEFESQAPVYITCVSSWNCCSEGTPGPQMLTCLKRGSGRQGSVEIKCHHIWSWEKERHGEIHGGWGEVCLQCHLEREALWCWGGRAEGLEPAPGSHSYLREVVFWAQLCKNSRELSVRQRRTAKLWPSCRRQYAAQEKVESLPFKNYLNWSSLPPRTFWASVSKTISCL